MRHSAWPLAAVLALALCGCNEASPVASTPAPATQAAPTDFANLPPGAPCTVRINKYQTVLDADHRTGNVEDPVYLQIEHELSDAAAACAAGHGEQSLAMVQASEAKHGYHT